MDNCTCSQSLPSLSSPFIIVHHSCNTKKQILKFSAGRTLPPHPPLFLSPELWRRHCLTTTKSLSLSSTSLPPFCPQICKELSVPSPDSLIFPRAPTTRIASLSLSRGLSSLSVLISHQELMMADSPLLDERTFFICVRSNIIGCGVIQFPSCQSCFTRQMCI